MELRPQIPPGRSTPELSWGTSVLQTPSLPTHGKNPAGAHGGSGPLPNPGTYQYILDLCCGMHC